MSKILVVDDDTDILSLVKTILTLNHFTVQTVAHWEQMEEYLQSFQPDLILLDLSLSGADGSEICKELKLREETKHIPVVLFSANVEMAKKVKDCNAQAYLAKPFNINELLQVIRSQLLVH